MVKHFSVWIAALLAALLVSCGGGADDAPRRATTAAVVAELRERAQALATAGGVTSAAAADQLMNFAESNFRQYFPANKATQSLPPFLYRYYPETGIHLGVVVTEGAGYTHNGVYVMGGEFGTEPRFVGPLTAFITPDPGGSGTNNGCYDVALFSTPGNRIVVNFDTSGDSRSSTTEEIVVGGLVSFEGREARELAVTTTERSDDGTFTDVGRFYGQFTGAAEYTDYGYTSTLTGTLSGAMVTVTSRAVWSPPTVDRQFGLAVGESTTRTQAGTTTTTTRGVPGVPEGPVVSTDTSNSTIKYLRRETITVPAGTYDTCRFEEVYSGDTSNTATTWVIFGKGIDVKIENRFGGIVETTVATSVTLNGNRL